MTDMDIAVRLRRETSGNTPVVFAGPQVFIDNVTDKISRI
ncbi:MAG: hypothetical protein A4E66_01777 [Syntrophus sp. PtaB.Bin001]|nr:MAG: hypothetical protein A4E66_01777 [Syntrophus sp. PtaB.Bin001]